MKSSRKIMVAADFSALSRPPAGLPVATVAGLRLHRLKYAARKDDDE
jgi:hypothetical protein